MSGVDAEARGWVDLDGERALDPAVVGRKAAGLARLRRAGEVVPDGVVVPVDAPDAVVASAVAAAVDRFGGPLAVRSSTTWEDHATSSSAGAGLTVLHVAGRSAVVAAVGACRAHPLPDGRAPGDGVAVLLQPMLAPSHAGVAFTADPVTGERDVVRIAAVAGVADRLLDGAARGLDLLVRADEVVGDAGAMPTVDVLAVAATARRLEAVLGGPQDVEWAVVDGAVVVLQARPVTVLPTPPSPLTGNGWQKDVAHYSELMSPFGFWALRSAVTATSEVFPAAGFLIDGLEERLVGGEVYGRVVPAIGGADPGRMPPPPAVVLGLAARIVPTLRRRTAAARETLDGGRTEAWIRRWVDEDRAGYVAFTADAAGRDLAALSDDALVAELDRLVARCHDGGRSHFEVFVPYVLAVHALHRTCSVLDGWDAAATAGLLAGASPATSDATRELAAVRDEVARDPDLVAALQRAPDRPEEVLAAHDPALGQALAAWVRTHGWRPPNYDAGAAVLAERPRLVTRLLLAVGPTQAVDVAAADERAADTRGRLPVAARPAFDEALARARRCYPLREDTVIVAGDVLLGLVHRWLREAGARLARRGVLGRGVDAAYCTGEELVAALRGTADVEGLRAAVVRRRGEEAWVRATPGPLVVGHPGGEPDVSRLPDALRRVNEAVLWFVGLEYPQPPDEVERGAALVVGIGAGGGSADGVVRIVRDHRDLDRLEAGDVLVCQVASPAWVPLFGLCAAVVADGGGAMSHVAIAAREHGLPAVLGCADATTVLREGQRVRVDGTSGAVTALDHA